MLSYRAKKICYNFSRKQELSKEFSQDISTSSSGDCCCMWMNVPPLNDIEVRKLGMICEKVTSKEYKVKQRLQYK